MRFIMPELPEVETIVRQLRPCIVGKTIIQMDIHRTDQWSLEADIVREQTVGRTMTKIERRGKFVVIHLDCRLCLVIHLRMTGKLTWRQGILAFEKYDRTIFHLQDRSFIHYNDTRALGKLEIVPVEQLAARFAHYAPDPFSTEFTRDYLINIVKKSRLFIKDFLIDQKKIGGIGNIYANEILFHSRINPTRPANSLTDAEINRLYSHIPNILSEAITHMGSTLGNHVSDYRNVYDKSGNYQAFLQVYGRQKKPCHQCNNQIVRIVHKGRSSFFCPVCQPIIGE